MGDAPNSREWEGEYRILRPRGCLVVIFAAVVVLMGTTALLNVALLPGSESPDFLQPVVRVIEASRDWFQNEARWWVDEAFQLLLAGIGLTVAYLLAMRTYRGTVELKAGELRVQRFPLDTSVELVDAEISLDDWVIPMMGRRGTRCTIRSPDGETIIGGRNHSPSEGSYGESGWKVDLQLDAAAFGDLLATLRGRDVSEPPRERREPRQAREPAEDRVEFVLSPSPYKNALGSSSADYSKTLRMFGGFAGTMAVLSVGIWVFDQLVDPSQLARIRETVSALIVGWLPWLLVLVPLFNIVVIGAIFAGWNRSQKKRIWLAVQENAIEFGRVANQTKYAAAPEEVAVTAGCYEIWTSPPHPNVWVPAIQINFPDGSIIVNSSETAETKGELPWEREVSEFEVPTDYSVSRGDWGRLVSALGFKGEDRGSSW